MITLKLAEAILLSHIKLYSLLSLSVKVSSLCLLFLCLIFVIWRVMGSLHYTAREHMEVIREQELKC